MSLLLPPGYTLPPPIAIPVDIDPRQHLMYLESRLSVLMDEKDVPGWKVNPAFHPDVTAFIISNRFHDVFFKKAKSLQQNRGRYYAKMCSRQPVSRPTVLGMARCTVLDQSSCAGRGTY